MPAEAPPKEIELFAHPCGLPMLPYIWPGKMPAKGLTAIVGEPRRGHFSAACDIAASFPNSDLWPDGKGYAPEGGVLVFIPNALPAVGGLFSDDPVENLKQELGILHYTGMDRIHFLEDRERYLSTEGVRDLDRDIKAIPDPIRLIFVPLAGTHFAPGGSLGGDLQSLHLRRLRAYALDRCLPLLVVVDIEPREGQPPRFVDEVREVAMGSYLPDCVDSLIAAGLVRG